MDAVSLRADAVTSPLSVSLSQHQLAPTPKSLHHHSFFFIPTQAPSHSWDRAEYKLYQEESGHLRTSPSFSKLVPFVFFFCFSWAFPPSPSYSVTAFWKPKLWHFLVWAARLRRLKESNVSESVFHVREFMCVRMKHVGLRMKSLEVGPLDNCLSECLLACLSTIQPSQTGPVYANSKYSRF